MKHVEGDILVGKGPDFEIAATKLGEEIGKLEKRISPMGGEIMGISSPIWKGFEHVGGTEGFLSVSVMYVIDN